LLADSVLVVCVAPKLNAGLGEIKSSVVALGAGKDDGNVFAPVGWDINWKGGVIVPASFSLLVVLLLVVVAVAAAAAAAPVGNTKELELLLLPSLAVVDVGKVKPEAAGADDESPDTAGGAEPKPPNWSPLLLLSLAVVEAVAGAAAPKENPPVVTGALVAELVAAAAAGALKLNPPVDTAPPSVVVDDDNDGAAAPNEKPLDPILADVAVVVVVAVVVPVLAVPPSPVLPGRGISQAAHTFNLFGLYELHVAHFHLSTNDAANAEPPHPMTAPEFAAGTYRALHLVHWLSMPSFGVSHLLQVHSSPSTAAFSRLFLVLEPVFSPSPSSLPSWSFSRAAASSKGWRLRACSLTMSGSVTCKDRHAGGLLGWEEDVAVWLG
jgi:hypothetical protein